MNEIDSSARARLIETRRGTWVDKSLFFQARRECLEIVEQVIRESEDSGIVEMLRGERKHLDDTDLGEHASGRKSFYSRYGWGFGSWEYNREAIDLLVERANEHVLQKEHEAWLLALRARDHEDMCGACGQFLNHGEAVYLGAEVYTGFLPIRWSWAGGPRLCVPRYERTVLCESCSPAWLMPGNGDVIAQLCAQCERPMVYRLTSSTMRRTFCSEPCQKAYHVRLRRERRAEEREKTCEICAKEFTATRKDAKTCSPGCKQKAYRRRQREARKNRR